MLLLLLLACVGEHGFTPTPKDPLATAPIIVLDPPTLDFGALPLGEELVLPLTVTNLGATNLEVASLAVRGAAAFTVVEPTTEALLAPDASTTFTVRFTPLNPEDIGSLEVVSDDPVRPVVTASLTGRALVPELRVFPDPLPFGDVPVDCTATQVLHVQNAGLTDLVLSTVASDSAAFTVDGASAAATLAPGDERLFEVSFTPTAANPYAGAVYVSSNDMAGFRSVVTEGAGTSDAAMEDVFQQGEQHFDKTDILLYVDGSNSMADDQENLTENFGAFVVALAEAEMDWQLIVVTGDDGCHNGPIFDLSNINTADLLEAVRGPAGTWSEAGLTLAYTALVDRASCNATFLRDDARTTVILVSDEPEQSPRPVVESVGRIRAEAPTATLHAIAGDVPDGCVSAEPGTGYDEAAALTGGAFLSICDADWGAYFRAIAERVASDQTDTFPLSAWPDPATIDVRVEGEAAVGWTWDADQNAVVFAADHWPAPGVTVTVDYRIDAVCGG